MVGSTGYWSSPNMLKQSSSNFTVYSCYMWSHTLWKHEYLSSSKKFYEDSSCTSLYVFISCLYFCSNAVTLKHCIVLFWPTVNCIWLDWVSPNVSSESAMKKLIRFTGDSGWYSSMSQSVAFLNARSLRLWKVVQLTISQSIFYYYSSSCSLCIVGAVDWQPKPGHINASLIVVHSYSFPYFGRLVCVELLAFSITLIHFQD